MVAPALSRRRDRVCIAPSIAQRRQDHALDELLARRPRRAPGAGRARGVARLAQSDDLQWPGPTRPPKIVGLDFAVDAAGDAWLLEVNRTPGLVGRADVDRAVKDAVVDAAWGLREDVLEELLL